MADLTNRDALNRANPNSLADEFRSLGLGDLLAGQLPQVVRGTNQVTNGTSPYNVATTQSYVPEGHSAASSIQRATARAGAVTGELSVVAYGTTPATTQIAVAPNGSIVTLAADAITDLDINYLPERGDVIEAVFGVTSNAIALSSVLNGKKAILLLEAEAVAGTTIGKKIVLVPGAAPATGQARINVAKDQVLFATADAVTRARVKLLVSASADLATYLTGVDNVI